MSMEKIRSASTFEEVHELGFRNQGYYSDFYKSKDEDEFEERFWIWKKPDDEAVVVLYDQGNGYCNFIRVANDQDDIEHGVTVINKADGVLMLCGSKDCECGSYMFYCNSNHNFVCIVNDNEQMVSQSFDSRREGIDWLLTTKRV